MIKRTLVAFSLILGATIALPVSAQAATGGWCSGAAPCTLGWCYDQPVDSPDICRRW
jgi:hypothetical protein